MPRKRHTHSRYIGTFVLPDERSVVGELYINGEHTLLELHSAEESEPMERPSSLKGIAYSGEYITLTDCNSTESSRLTAPEKPVQYSLNVFPHYVAIGRTHLDPLQPSISRIEFSTTDLSALFYDFDAFGLVLDAKPIIDTVLGERRKLRTVETGDDPMVAYFSGRDCIADIPTTMGRVSAHHRPTFNTGGPAGVYMKNRISVAIEPDSPITFDQAVEKVSALATFLSFAAGRSQGISHLLFLSHDGVSGTPQEFTIHPSFPWKVKGIDSRYKASPGDVPLDPIRRPEEFKTVLADWIDKHGKRRISRHRYLESLRKTNRYGADRLVAAANMFDLLPKNAVPADIELPEDLANTRDECLEKLRALPESLDRNSAISSLAQLGRISLPRKIAHRAGIVECQLSRAYPELAFVANLAARCRNIFVHGQSGKLKLETIEPFVPFLTDTLEFVFAASDFIEAGWDATRWLAAPFGHGHSFSRFRWDYTAQLTVLKQALEK
jgi:hypothetical protein